MSREMSMLANKWLLMLMACVGAAVLPATRAQAATRCEATEHGMRAGGEDNTAALERTLKECAGQTIHIAAGVYELMPKNYQRGLTVSADTTLEGDGNQGDTQSVLRVSGGSFAAVLWIRNVSNVTIRGLRFEGSKFESGCVRHLDYGHAIFVQSDAGQTASIENINIEGNAFRDFNGTSWVTLNAVDGSGGIGRSGPINIRHNVFESDDGLLGSCAGSGITHSTAMVSLHGSDKSAQGMVSNVAVSSNTFNAAYVNTAVAVWSDTSQITIEQNEIRDTGAKLVSAPRTEFGRYAIVIYNSAHELPGLHPDTVSVIGNVITNPVSCGIYVASAQNLQITGNRISGQSDRFDVTLPKGAIALNHAKGVRSLSDNELVGNYIGISSVGSEISMGTNRIVAGAGGSSQKIVGNAR